MIVTKQFFVLNFYTSLLHLLNKAIIIQYQDDILERVSCKLSSDQHLTHLSPPAAPRSNTSCPLSERERERERVGKAEGVKKHRLSLQFQM